MNSPVRPPPTMPSPSPNSPCCRLQTWHDQLLSRHQSCHRQTPKVAPTTIFFEQSSLSDNFLAGRSLAATCCHGRSLSSEDCWSQLEFSLASSLFAVAVARKYTIIAARVLDLFPCHNFGVDHRHSSTHATNFYQLPPAPSPSSSPFATGNAISFSSCIVENRNHYLGILLPFVRI